MGLRVSLFMDIVFAILFLSLLKVVAARYPRNAEGRVRDFLLTHSNYSARDRPVLNPNDTVYVGLQMELYAMLDLNERDEVLTTASWMSLVRKECFYILKQVMGMKYWTDERLTWDPADFEGEDLLMMYPDEIWIPKVFLSNSLNKDALGTTSPDRGSIILTSDGLVILGVPSVQSTQCPMDIRYFPFDTQKCPFDFLPENHIAEHMILYVENTPTPPQLESLEWDVLNVTVFQSVFAVSNYVPNRDAIWYSEGIVCVILKRDANYYVLTLILPSTLMCILAFATFLAPPDSGERISLGVSMVLGLTVFQLLIADLLPASSKQTPVLSKYLTCNFVLACLAVPFSLMNIDIAYGDNKLRLLKYAWIRKLFLEYLPYCFSIPSYPDRVRCEIMDVKALSEMNNEAITGYDLAVVKKNLVEHSEQPVLKDRLSSSKKIKLEARTVALVMDRLVLFTFLIAFVVVVIVILVDYGNMPDVTFDNCEIT